MEARLTEHMLEENGKIASQAAMLCNINKQLHAMQMYLLKNFAPFSERSHLYKVPSPIKVEQNFCKTDM